MVMLFSLEFYGIYGYLKFVLGWGYNYNRGQLDNQVGNDVIFSDFIFESVEEDGVSMLLRILVRLVGSI